MPIAKPCQNLPNRVEIVGQDFGLEFWARVLGQDFWPGFWAGILGQVQVQVPLASPGEHWLAEYREGDIRLLYDSFGRLPSVQWQPRLRGVETTEPDAEQPPVDPDGSKTEWCGQACLAFGLVCKAYGYKIARAV